MNLREWINLVEGVSLGDALALYGGVSDLPSLRKRRNELVRAHHPDINPDAEPEMIKRINAGYDLLKNRLDSGIALSADDLRSPHAAPSAKKPKSFTIIEPAETGPPGNPWDIYQDSVKTVTPLLDDMYEQVEREITQSITRENTPQVLKSAFEKMFKFMATHSKAGAADTEPRHILASKLNHLVSELGFDEYRIDRFGGITRANAPRSMP